MNSRGLRSLPVLFFKGRSVLSPVPGDLNYVGNLSVTYSICFTNIDSTIGTVNFKMLMMSLMVMKSPNKAVTKKIHFTMIIIVALLQGVCKRLPEVIIIKID